MPTSYGNKYARIEYSPGEESIGGMYSIADTWASLQKVGFNQVDGALIVPGSADQVFMFSGDYYCRIRFHEGENDDELLDGPKLITAGWSAMKFSDIDTIFPKPGSASGACVFSGGKYVEIKVNANGSDELVSNERDVASYWPSLHQADFY